MSIKQDFTPVVNGKLTQVGLAFRSSRQHVKSAVFKCECGKHIVTMLRLVRIGTTKTCGNCIANKSQRTTKTQKRSRAYATWLNMRQRCFSKSNKNYDNYGGRGITICDRWLSFLNFQEDMGEPEKGLSLDRIDNDGGYSKENCRWATATIQNNNKRPRRINAEARDRTSRRVKKPRNIRTITHNGQTKSISEWAKETGIYDRTIAYRFKRGYSPTECLSHEDHRAMKDTAGSVDK